MLNERFPNLHGAMFDLDGTLLDSMGAWSQAPIQYLTALGLRPDEALVRRFSALSPHQQAQVLRQEYGVQRDEGEIIAGYHDIMERFYRNTVCQKPGAGRFLAGLAERGIPLCVVSATPGRLVRIALERTGLSRYFFHIFSAWDLGTTKRKPDIFKLAQQAMGLGTEQVWVFEDALYAMETAKTIGYSLAAVEEDTAKAQAKEIRRIADVWIPSYELLLQEDNHPSDAL